MGGIAGFRVMKNTWSISAGRSVVGRGEVLALDDRARIGGVLVAVEVDGAVLGDVNVLQDGGLVGRRVVEGGLFVRIEADGLDEQALALAAGDGTVGEERANVVLQHRRLLWFLEAETVGRQRRLPGAGETEEHLADGLHPIVGLEVDALGAGVEAEAALSLWRRT